MLKLVLVPLLFLIACLFAGTYGALHNQISYSVSPEYFTEFKFHQFGYDRVSLPGRHIVAMIGWHASWWMGLIIGTVLIPLGLVIRGGANYFWVMLRVFGVVAFTTLLVGLIALAVAYVVVDPNTIGEFTRFGNEIKDDAAFARAGTMHNFSYIGGLVGIISGIATIFRQRNRLNAIAAQSN